MLNDSGERDPTINRLFAAAERVQPEKDFLRQVITRLEREQRRRFRYMIAKRTALAVVGAIVAARAPFRWPSSFAMIHR